jgi:hypothetical protein
VTARDQRRRGSQPWQRRPPRRREIEHRSVVER